MFEYHSSGIFLYFFLPFLVRLLFSTFRYHDLHCIFLLHSPSQFGHTRTHRQHIFDRRRAESELGTCREKDQVFLSTRLYLLFFFYTNITIYKARNNLHLRFQKHRCRKSLFQQLVDYRQPLIEIAPLDSCFKSLDLRQSLPTS